MEFFVQMTRTQTFSHMRAYSVDLILTRIAILRCDTYMLRQIDTERHLTTHQ